MAYKVLIFDDDLDILELCSIILRRNGFETYGESNSKNVLAKIKEVNPHVILMDNWMPGLGGVEATQLIKNTDETKNIPVILFSANNNIESIAQQAKADYYLKKPFDIATLNMLVGKAINQG